MPQYSVQDFYRKRIEESKKIFNCSKTKEDPCIKKTFGKENNARILLFFFNITIGKDLWNYFLICHVDSSTIIWLLWPFWKIPSSVPWWHSWTNSKITSPKCFWLQMDQNKNCIHSDMVHTVPSSHAPGTIKWRSGIAMMKDIVTCPKPTHLISEMQ